jgi:DNA-binding MarR family transcriptional regulator
MEPFSRLFDELRMLEHRLGQVADKLHASGEVSTPGRAVLEFLTRFGPTSVPDIARARYVTRQHVRSIVDALVAGALIEPASNPAHRRSSLFTLTDKGRDALAAMQEREHELIRRRFEAIERPDVDKAADVLAAIRNALDDERGNGAR